MIEIIPINPTTNCGKICKLTIGGFNHKMSASELIGLESILIKFYQLYVLEDKNEPIIQA
jgi:hypothetical protein